MNPDSNWGEYKTPIYYEVSIKQIDDGVYFDIHRGLTEGFLICVHPPNFIESLLGITFENKVQKAKMKAYARCNEINRKISLARDTIGTVN